MYRSPKFLRNNSISQISNSTEKIKKGSAFFAISGANVDGNNFIPEAIKKGAKIIVSSKKSSLRKVKNNKIIKIYSKNIRRFYSEECSRIFEHPSKKISICGITGTNGKSSVAALLTHIWTLESSGVIGTINIQYGNKKEKSKLTTPDCYEINKVLNKMKEKRIRNLFMEASSHALEQERVHGIEFESAIFTNLTQDHFDFHKNMTNYFKAKKKLFSQYLNKSNKKNKFGIINIDDKYGLKILNEKKKSIKYYTYSMKNPSADFYIQKINKVKKKYELKIVYMKKNCKVLTPMFGNFNFENILAAFAYSIIKKKPLKIIIDKIASFKGAKGRLEPVGKKQKVIFIDYAHTHDALEKTLKSIKIEYPNNKIITVFGCGGDRDIKKRAKMGEVGVRYSNKVYLTNDNPRTEDPKKIINDIVDGTKNSKKIKIILNREEAIKKAIVTAEKKDVILIAGKGHENYQEINGVREAYSDHKVVSKILKDETL